MSDEEELCLCGNGHICTCVFELDWMKDLLDPLYDEGFLHGEEDGIEDGIYDTRYNRPSKEDFLVTPDTPVSAYIDPCGYQRAYADGYRQGYRQVFKLHRPLLVELAMYHRVLNTKIYLLLHFGNHPLLELALFDKIENFVWVRK